MSDLLPHPVTGAPFASPVRPGTGWPDDPGTARTPCAHDAAEVERLAAGAALGDVDARVSVCCACPRLVEWREQVAHDKRASFADEPYWGRPIPGWGETEPRLLIVGLAPAANGGNRTGRIFTGDRSGDWLFRSLHRVGLAAQERSEHAGDGQRLLGARMVAAVRCAPPDNKPTVTERDTCAPWLRRELELVLPSVRAVVCLGSYGWDATLRTLRALGWQIPRPKPKFGHAAEAVVHRPVVKGATRGQNPAPSDGSAVRLLGCFHPSQQNTFTGRLTEPMLDAVLGRAAELAGGVED
jgi:uracil-DNA glycosylase family 4